MQTETITGPRASVKTKELSWLDRLLARERPADISKWPRWYLALPLVRSIEGQQSYEESDEDWIGRQW